jgi:hypothetical protein
MRTFLLLRAGTPNEMPHERVLCALRMIDLQNASLQRDASRLRSGLLTDPDALSFTAHSLRPALPIMLMTRPEGTSAILRSKSNFIRDVLPKPLQSRRLGESPGRHRADRVTQQSGIQRCRPPTSSSLTTMRR